MCTSMDPMYGKTVEVSPSTGTDDLFSAMFVRWGTCFMEFEQGLTSYTTAIVVDSKGQVHEMASSQIRFLD